MMDFNEAVQNIKQTAALMPAEYRTAAALGTGYLIGAYGKKLACGVADVISDVNEALYNRAQFGSGILNKTWYAMNEAICRYYDLVDKIDKKKHIRNDLPEKMFEKPVATGLEGELQKFDVWNKGFSEETNEIVFTLMEKKGFDHAIIRQQVNVSDTYQKFMDFLSGKPQRSPYTLIEYFTNDVLDEDKRVNIIAMVNSKYKTVECDCSVPEYFLDKRQLLEFINSVPDVPHKRIQKDIDFLKYSLKLMINKRETLDNLLGNKLGKEIDKSKKQRPKNGSGDSEVA